MLTELEFETMDELCNLLQPLKDFTLLLSGSKYPTISMLYPCVTTLKNELDVIEFRCDKLQILKESLSHSLGGRFQYILNEPIFLASTFLDFKFKKFEFIKDETLRERGLVKVNQFLISFLKIYFKEDFVVRVDENNNETLQYDLDDENRSLNQLDLPSQPSRNNSESRIASSLIFYDRINRDERQRLDRGRNRGISLLDKIFDSKDTISSQPLSNLESEIESYKNHVNNINLGNNKEELIGPLAFFKTYEKTFPLLSKIAKAIFSIPATSVPSECLFSRAGLIQTDIRNKLSPSNLENLIFIKDNKQAKFII